MKQPGEPAKLTYDSPRDVNEGDYIRTMSGRTYLVERVRVQERGKWAGRKHLSTIVMAPDHEVEPDAIVHLLCWYPR